MTRRELLALVAGGLSTSRTAIAQHAGMGTTAAGQTPPVGPADVTLRIRETTIELGPRRVVKTLAYNGQVPGPLLRAQAGRPLTVASYDAGHMRPPMRALYSQRVQKSV